MKLKSVLMLGGIYVLASSIATAAMAQDDVGPPEIVVTAQKRAENVQDVPIAISVVGGGQLAQQNVVTTSDLIQAVPALSISNFGVFQVRSLGTQGFGRSAEQSVSVVLDGVALPRPQAYELANGLFDVERVEVLSGPQGTLFGKNATAGVINIVSKAPVLGEFEGGMHADVGTHDVINLSGVVNIPIGSTAALRVVGHYNTQGRIVYNTLFNKWDHSSDAGFRARFRWEPSDNLRVNIIGDYQKLESNGVNGMTDFAGVSVIRAAPPGSPLAATLASCGIVAGPKNNKVCGDSLYDPNVKRGDVYGARRRGVSAQIDWDFAEGYTFTSITAYRRDNTGDFDVDGNFAGGFGDTLPDNLLQRNLFPSSARFFSEEMRVQSPATDRVNFVAGLYYSQNHRLDHVDQSGGFGVLGPVLQFRRVNDIDAHAYNYAAFGHVNFQATDQLKVFAGARITRDKFNIISTNSYPEELPAGPFLYTGNLGFFSLYPINSCTFAGGNPGSGNNTGSPSTPASCPAGTSLTEPARLSKTGVTWKLGAQYDITPQTMVYATFTRGYKGPFINDQSSAVGGVPVPPELMAVKAEKPDAYEIGLKTRLFNRFNLNVALFNTKANNFQTTVYIPNDLSGLAVSSFFQGNAKYALTRGVDIGLVGNITENFSVNASLLYNQARFNKGFLVPCASEADGTCEARRQMPYAPKWKTTVSGEYKHDIGKGAQAFLQSDLTYTSSYPFGSTPAPETFESGSRYILGARTGLRIDEDRFSISVFCRNCLDKRYPVAVTPYSLGYPGQGQQAQFLNLGSYRVIGLSVDAKL